MIRKFYAQQEEFDEIVAQVSQWPGEFVFYTNDINNGRIPPYYEVVDIELLRKRLKRLGLRNVALGRDGDSYSISMSFHFKNEAKGYVYQTEPPNPFFVEENLNRSDQHGRGYGSIYHPIEGNWYLFMTVSESFWYF